MSLHQLRNRRKVQTLNEVWRIKGRSKLLSTNILLTKKDVDDDKRPIFKVLTEKKKAENFEYFQKKMKEEYIKKGIKEEWKAQQLAGKTVALPLAMILEDVSQPLMVQILNTMLDAAEIMKRQKRNSKDLEDLLEAVDKKEMKAVIKQAIELKNIMTSILEEAGERIRKLVDPKDKNDGDKLKPILEVIEEENDEMWTKIRDIVKKAINMEDWRMHHFEKYEAALMRRERQKHAQPLRAEFERQRKEEEGKEKQQKRKKNDDTDTEMEDATDDYDKMVEELMKRGRVREQELMQLKMKDRVKLALEAKLDKTVTIETAIEIMEEMGRMKKAEDEEKETNYNKGMSKMLEKQIEKINLRLDKKEKENDNEIDIEPEEALKFFGNKVQGNKTMGLLSKGLGKVEKILLSNVQTRGGDSGMQAVLDLIQLS